MRKITMLLLFVSSMWLQVAPVCSQVVDKLSVSISKSEKQWGQYLRATLKYQGLESLENIDLQSWENFVAIKFEDVYNDEDKAGDSIQVLQLRLYPRKTGVYLLPSLNMGNVQSQSINIHITEAQVKNATIKLDWNSSTASPWQREAVIVRVQLQTTDYAARIKLDELTDKRFISRPLKIQRHSLADGSYRFDAGWVLYPMLEGSLILDLPAIRYQISGSDRRVFYFPQQQFQVKSLPTYLPPTLPVGRLNVTSFIDEEEKWQLSIKTDAFIPYGLAELDLQFMNMGGSNVVISQSQQSTYDGNISVYSLRIPEWLMPLGKDLKLSLRYFNTETGRLAELSHSLPRQLNMPIWAYWMVGFFSLIFFALSLRFLQPILRIKMRQRALRRRLRSVTDVNQLRKIILQYEKVLTLSEWGRINPARKHVVRQLNYYCFSDIGPLEYKNLKSQLLQLS